MGAVTAADVGGVLVLGGAGGAAVVARLMDSTSTAKEAREDLKSCMMANMSRAMLGPALAVGGGTAVVGGALVDVAELGSDVGGIAGVGGSGLERRGVTEGLRGMLRRSAFSGSTPVGATTVSSAGILVGSS